LRLAQIFDDSFEYTKKLFSKFGRLIILIIFNLIPLISWIVSGYAARVLRESPGTSEPPELEKYSSMFVDGAKIFFASLIYMLIPIALIGAGIGSFIVGLVIRGWPDPLRGLNPSDILLFGGAAVVLVVIGVVLGFIMLILLAAGIAHMIKTGKFGKAFAFGEVLNVIRGIGWVRYLGWIIIVAVVSIIVGAIVSSIPYVGWVIGAIISPGLSVFFFRSLGLLYNEGAPPSLMVPVTPSVAMTCASCGVQLQPHQRYCPGCGAPAPTPSAASAPEPQAETKFCMSCGSRIPTAASFCPSCGARQ